MKEFIKNYYLKDEELGKVPQWLDLEINTNCNLICKKCFRTYYIAKTEFMNLGLIERIIKEFGEKGMTFVQRKTILIGNASGCINTDIEEEKKDEDQCKERKEEERVF